MQDEFCSSWGFSNFATCLSFDYTQTLFEALTAIATRLAAGGFNETYIIVFRFDL
jgi:hypothetical protein